MNVAANPERVAEQLRRIESMMDEVDPVVHPVLRALDIVIRRVQQEGAPLNPVFLAVAAMNGGWTVSRRVIDGQAAVRVEFSQDDAHGPDLRKYAAAVGLATLTPQTRTNYIPILLGAS